MRFLFVMKLSRFMVKATSSTSASSALVPATSRMYFVSSRTHLVTFIAWLHAERQLLRMLLQEFSEIVSRKSGLKKSSALPEQILQALLEMTELILATHLSWFD